MGAVVPVVLLLRSVNVGGHNRVPMADLRRLVASLGATDVVTHLQSGNVVCASPVAPDALAAATARALDAELGVAVPVLARTGPELTRLVAAPSFSPADLDPTRLLVTFLDAVPDRRRTAALGAEAGSLGPDRCTVSGSHVFVHCAGRSSDSPFSNAFLERRLGVVATTRNGRTVRALAELAGRVG